MSSVEPGSPGEKAGLRAGDVITAVNGVHTDDMNTLRNRVASTAPGSDVTLAVIRDGKQQQVHARLDELTPNEETSASPGGGPEGRGGQLGVTVDSLTPERATQLGLRRGTQGVVVTDVDPTSPAAQAGIQADDVIMEVNRQPVKSTADFRAALRNSGSRPVLLLINRDGRTVFIAVQPR